MSSNASIQLALIDRAIDTFRRPKHVLDAAVAKDYFVQVGDHQGLAEDIVTRHDPRTPAYCAAGSIHEAALYFVANPLDDAAYDLVDDLGGTFELTNILVTQGRKAVLAHFKEKRDELREIVAAAA